MGLLQRIFDYIDAASKDAADTAVADNNTAQIGEKMKQWYITKAYEVLYPVYDTDAQTNVLYSYVKWPDETRGRVYQGYATNDEYKILILEHEITRDTNGKIIKVPEISIQTLANIEADILALNPIAYYPLNDAVAATTALDLSGNNYHATIAGIKPGSDGIFKDRTIMSFDGTDFVTRINATSSGITNKFNLNEYTIIFRIRVNKKSQWTDASSLYMFSIQTDVGDTIYVNKSGAYVIQFVDNVNGKNRSPYDTIPTELKNTKWHTIAISKSATKDRVIQVIDGIDNGREHSTNNVGTSIKKANLFNIGCYTNTRGNWLGDMFDFIVFDRELTLQEHETICGITDNRTRILHIGDSTTKGDFDTSTPPLTKNGWVYYMEILGNIRESPERLGTGFSTVSSQLTAAPYQIYQSGCSIPDYLWFNMGKNDCFVAGLTKEVWIANYIALIELWHAAYPTAPVFIDKIQRTTAGPVVPIATLDDIWIPEIIATLQYCHLGIDERTIMNTFYTSDGIHPNHNGHVAIAKAKIARLETFETTGV